MIRLLLIALIVALSACTTAPASSVKAAGKGNISGVATLAMWGEWESDLAPAYTRLAVLRRAAARQLTAGQIDTAAAIRIQKTADQARALLDQSRRGDAKNPSLEQRAQLAEAQRLIASAEGVLK